MRGPTAAFGEFVGSTTVDWPDTRAQPDLGHRESQRRLQSPAIAA
jgi:hypothetical protein